MELEHRKAVQRADEIIITAIKDEGGDVADIANVSKESKQAGDYTYHCALLELA